MTLLLPLSHTVVDSVMLVELVLMVLVTITQVTTGLVAYRLSISVSTLLIGPLSRFQGQPSDYTEAMLNPS